MTTDSQNQTWTETLENLLGMAKPPSLAEILASQDNPYSWLDHEFDVPLERAIAKVEEGSMVRGSQGWRDAIRSWYNEYWWEYWRGKPDIPFVPASDEQLREWEERYAMCGFSDEVKDLYRLATTIERLRDHWREANEVAKKHVTPKKSERDYSRVRKFQDLIQDDLEITRKWLLVKNAPPPPPLLPSRIEIDLPPGWFAEDNPSVPAKSIRDTLEKLAPIAHYALEEWYPDLFVEVTDDYVLAGAEESGFAGDEEFGFKVSRTTGVVWTAHHGGEIFGDLLNLFQHYSRIDDPEKSWRKLDLIRRRIEQTNPEILAERDRARKKRRQWAEEEYLTELKETIWASLHRAGRTTPPPVGKKRAKKTVRAFWEWLFLPDSWFTSARLQQAFEYWEKSGDDQFFRVESKVYPKMTNWVLTATSSLTIPLEAPQKVQAETLDDFYESSLIHRLKRTAKK